MAIPIESVQFQLGRGSTVVPVTIPERVPILGAETQVEGSAKGLPRVTKAEWCPSTLQVDLETMIHLSHGQ